MNFNQHYNLAGKHAFLGASTYHWVNYTPEKLELVWNNQQKKEQGVILHNFASVAIENRVKLARHKKALNMFVNDCIGFKMQSEQILYYSDNAFGTADAISFEDDILRIFDLKTGISKPSFKQLDIYAALFCLEYGINPHDITIITRIYQGNDYMEEVVLPANIVYVMDKLVTFDTLIENFE